jgi:nicotinamidase/pyrazinamidase
MHKEVFVDIDTQFDFMSPKGKLYVPGAEDIIPVLKRLTLFADKSAVPIVSSLDSHIKNDPEFKSFPEHCLKNSPGQAKIKATLARNARQVFIPKSTYDLFSNPKAEIALKGFYTAYVYGVALDYCVKFSCLGLVRSGKETYLVKDATVPVSRKDGRETLKLLKRKGVKFVNSASLIRRLSKCKRK